MKSPWGLVETTQLTLLVAFAAGSGVYFLVEPHFHSLMVSNPGWSSHACGSPLALASALSAAVRPFIPPDVLLLRVSGSALITQ